MALHCSLQGWTLGHIRVQKILTLNSWEHNSKDLAILHVKITFPHVEPRANMTLHPILLARRLLSPSQRGEDHSWLSVGTETAFLQKSCVLPLYQVIREPRCSLPACCSAPAASTGAPRELGCHKGCLSNQPAWGQQPHRLGSTRKNRPCPKDSSAHCI